MNPIKKLAGQTAVYGIPSIVGRVLNYLLVPIYTRVFIPSEYGIVTLMYSFVAVAFIILTYGMETSFFRYSELQNDKRKVYSNAMLSIILTTSTFVLFIFLFTDNIAAWIKYPDYTHFIAWLGLIISLDVLTAIPFAKLRADNKPGRFAMIKIINISVNIGLNLFFILLCPYIYTSFNSGFFYRFVMLVFDPEIMLISYVFISNLIASIITLFLIIPEIFKIKIEFDIQVWKRMMVYGLPLLFAGLAGIMNETLGRILIRYLLPEDVAEAQLGIYAACYKIAILMSLFIQAFRYAAEPFFFSYAKQSDSKEVYAQVMKYFVIAISALFLVLMLYLDVIVLLIGKEFREGIHVVPILLLAYMFLGIYYNLSVWFKLTNNTKYGAWMAIFGAVITVVVNVILIPRIGYTGSAWATLICYAAIMILSFVLMNRFFPIRYNYFKILFYMGLAIMLYFVSTFFVFKSTIMHYLINTLLLLIYLLVFYRIEGKDLVKLIRHS